MAMNALPAIINSYVLRSRLALSTSGQAFTLRRTFSCATAVFFLACAAFYFLTTLFAIANFAWPQPMFDQWRMYESFLELPFPQNVLQLENGHRPIIPNLFRVAETYWLSGNQLLQISIGTACLLTTWGLLVRVVWRGTFIGRAAMVMLVTLGLFWLANSRMLLHGNESLHVYLLTMSITFAALSTYQAQRRHSLRWFALATAWCSAAMFCFGPGVASFPAVVILAIGLRLPLRWLLLPAAALVLCLAVYFILPGGNGVRHMLALDPWGGLLTSARWLSSPWVNAWFGFAEPTLYPWMHRPPDRAVVHVLRGTATYAVNATGIGWRDLSSVVGLTGFIACGICCGVAFFAKRRPDQLETVMLGIAVFAAATAGVIGVGRLDYLSQYPDQVYADRYLVWPSLFWMSMGVLFLHRASQQRWSVSAFAYLAVLLLPVALLPTQSASAISAALVYRNSQANAAALESGVYDEDHFPAAGVGRERTLREIALVRDHQIAMFADGAWQRVGTRWSGALTSASNPGVTTQWLTPVADPTAQKPAGHLEGWVTRGAGDLQKHGKLAILDDEGMIAGLAEWSFLGPDSPALLLSKPRKHGFDGYIRDIDPQKKYRLVLLDFAANEGISLTELAMVELPVQ